MNGGDSSRDMNNLSTKTSGGYYNNNDKSKRTPGSFYIKYYDKVLTKLNLQSREQGYEHGMQHLPQNQKMQAEEVLHDQIGNSRRKRILLVDDEPDICMVYQMVLEDAGYECIPYTDPIKALKEFRIDYYDLILLDIKMPVLDGFELCKKIREVDKIVHIIFITASEAYYEKFRSQRFPELGKINYIQKPIGNEELVQIVNTIIATTITVD
jgi:CheY-like chemotaxis protein